MRFIRKLAGLGFGVFAMCFTPFLSAQINRWDDGSVIPGTEHIELVPGAKLNDLDLEYARIGSIINDTDLRDATFENSNLRLARFNNVNLTSASLTNTAIPFARFEDMIGFTAEQFYSTSSYRYGDLVGLDFRRINAEGWNFRGVNLSDGFLFDSNFDNANFSNANLTGVSFSDSTLTNANLIGATINDAALGTAVSEQQLYSTASYQEKNMSGVRMFGHDLSGWKLAEQSLAYGGLSDTVLFQTDLRQADLSNVSLSFASLAEANLEGADLSFADLRGSTGFDPTGIASLRNTILPDGRIEGATLQPGEVLHVPLQIRAPIVRVEQELVVDEGTVLQFRVTSSRVEIPNSVLQTTSKTNVQLGGTLRVRSSTRHQPIGGRFDLFNWRGGVPDDQRFSTIELPAGRWDLSELYTTGEITLVALGEPGDYDADGILGSEDIDRLSSVIRAGVNARTYDADHDDEMTPNDRDYWVHRLKNTYFGDANLDGEFSSSDLVRVFSAGKYENPELTAGWSEGDWDGNGVFSTGDLVAAFADGGYEQGPRTGNVAVVPEPSCIVYLIGFVFWIIGRRRASVALKE